MKRSQLISLSALALMAALSLTACGGRAPGITPDQPEAVPTQDPSLGATQPVYNDPSLTAPSAPYTDPYANPMPTAPINTMPIGPTGQANAPAGNFMVDQGNLVYGWRARGITVSGGAIYVAAVDNDGLTKNGTVLKMDAISGKNWKDLSTGFMGLSSDLSSTLQGVAIAGGNLFALDATGGMFSLSTSGGNVKELKGAGGVDIAGSNSGLFIAANGMLERSDMSGMSRSPMNGIPASAGIGTDSRGNLFFLAGNRVGLIDAMTGQPRDLITMGLNAPIDVAADGRNGDVYVIDGADVKRFDTAGQLAAQFPHGAAQATSIAVDESGNVYVADYGTSSQDSKVLKFSAVMNGGMMNGMPQTGYGQPQMGYGQPTGGYGQTYGAYSAPQTAYTQQRATYPQAVPQTAYAQPRATYPQAMPQQQAPVYAAPQQTTRRY
ncbi:MAG: hypothetical protein ACO1RX_00570 [Candidatus Sericytochromatia bacterium]